MNRKIALSCLSLVVFLLHCEPAAAAPGLLRARLRQRIQQQQNRSADAGTTEKLRLAGLDVAVWEPSKFPPEGAPLVIFSHGLHGTNTQSTFLTEALSADGFLVMAPNHADALGAAHGLAKPEQKLGDASAWNDNTYKDRAQDIARLVSALHKDQFWSTKINWSQVVLAGHSLGGYTALGCAGGWPTWKLPEIKAVLALSPYCQPFAYHHTLSQIKVPVMYQSGTRDLGILPFITKRGGAFDQTSSPAYLVVLDRAGHFAFSNLNRDKSREQIINYYALAFLHKCLQPNGGAQSEITKRPGVANLTIK